MHSHRIATLLLGMWLAGLIAITYVATNNFHQTDHLLLQPSEGAAKLLAPLSKGDARMLLRHQASELNRLYFNAFEWSEIVLGCLLTAAVLPMSTPRIGWRVLAPSMLLLTLFMHYLLTPEITSVGRGLDFIEPGLQTPEREHFWRLHNLYSGMVLVKLAMAAALTGRLIIQRSHRQREMDSRKEVDRINNGNHREVNR